MEWLGHHSYLCYFAGGIRCVGKGGNCTQLLLIFAVAGEAGFHCGCFLPLPRPQNTLGQRNTQVSLISLYGSGSLFLPGQVHWRKDFPVDTECVVQAVALYP